jgi:DNA-binding protein Fis
MAWTEANVASVTKVEVETTTNRGHPPEFWAKLAADRIVQVSDSAHPAIREQAVAFRDNVEKAILLYMKRAIQSDRTTVYNLVLEAGQPNLAELLRRP